MSEILQHCEAFAEDFYKHYALSDVEITTRTEYGWIRHFDEFNSHFEELAKASNHLHQDGEDAIQTLEVYKFPIKRFPLSNSIAHEIARAYFKNFWESQNFLFKVRLDKLIQEIEEKTLSIERLKQSIASTQAECDGLKSQIEQQKDEQAALKEQAMSR